MTIHAEPAQPPGNLPGWKLIWNDEFDGTSFDESKWNVMEKKLHKNKEKQYYAADECYVEKGCAVLRSQKREIEGRPYTSGHLDTREKFSFEYGRVEVRAKLPKGKGIWPAHWMLPEDRRWPPEIDIMEMLGHKPNRILMTVHHSQLGKPAHAGFSYVGPDYSDDFHTFAVEWEPDRITWYIDGKRRHMDKLYSPDTPFFIILNTAVGGILPGNPDETTVFPVYHFIDYVRVWKRDETTKPIEPLKKM
jgi:beta-glucanase (GH16 family)